jgi:class 3 adenylate cyclase
MAGETATSATELGRAALARHEWRAAYDILRQADASGQLATVDFDLLAQAAWWTGQLPVAIEVRERAYAAAVKSGDVQSAVIAAITLARDHMFRMATSVAAAWLNRAEELLKGADENPAHGWLAGTRTFYAALTGDSPESLRQAERARDIGVRFGDRDLETLGLGAMAAALLAVGRVEEGLKLADEATRRAVSGELLEPAVAGGVCCTTIEACAGIGDFRRAAEWTEAQDRWCRREGINGYPGMCRLFRSDVKRLRGSWPEAEAEARAATDELRGFMPAAAGLALYLIAEIRLARGDLPAAEEALLGAHALGTDTQPVFALLRLAQGRPEVAATSIRQALDEPGRTPSWQAPPDSDLYRLRLLPARAEIALATHDLDTAHAAAQELETLAERFATPAARANAETATGRVALARGDAVSAVRHLREAVRLWAELDAPYDTARARTALAEAHLADEAADSAGIELRTARDTFERLGAAGDLRQAEEALRRLQESTGQAPMGTEAARVTRAFMFTDIVDSTRLAETLGDEAWERMRRWHDRTLRSAAAEQGGEEVKATGDGFFFTFADADHALEAAIAIQRRLASQRETQGFAPEVRIGIHSAEANRVGLDYHGIGVNVAARLADAAGGGEVMVSGATLLAARHAYSEVARRLAELKGISEPIEVVSVGWR